MNRPINPQNVKIEECFAENGDDIRFLIVANKFQVGFNEKMLHTMFLIKPCKTEMQFRPLVALNRIYPDKKFDTLTVDFTNSYDKIIKHLKSIKVMLKVIKKQIQTTFTKLKMNS